MCFVCLLACVFACSLVAVYNLFVCSFVFWFASFFICLLARSLVDVFACWFACLFVYFLAFLPTCLFVCLLARLFICLLFIY